MNLYIEMGGEICTSESEEKCLQVSDVKLKERLLEIPRC